MGRDADARAHAAGRVAGGGGRRCERADAGAGRLRRVPALAARRGAGIRGGESVSRAAIVIASLWLASAASPANAKSSEAKRERERRAQALEDLDIDIDLDLPDLAIPDIDIPDIDIDLPQMLARSMPHDRRVDEDEDDDHDVEVDVGDDDDVAVTDDRGGKAKIYKLNKQRAIRVPRMHLGEDDHDSAEREATAQAKGRGSATLPVKGPVTFQIRAQAGEVEVVGSDRKQVSVTLSEAPAEDIALFAFGDRVEPSFHGRRTLRRGKLRVELP